MANNQYQLDKSFRFEASEGKLSSDVVLNFLNPQLVVAYTRVTDTDGVLAELAVHIRPGGEVTVSVNSRKNDNQPMNDTAIVDRFIAAAQAESAAIFAQA